MTEEFIQKAIVVHGDKYDYSKVEYVKSSKKVIIICKEHDGFLQIPNNHLRGAGCRFCGLKKISLKLKHTKELFIVKAIETHGDKYDYSLVVYKNAKHKVIIICKTHGEFKQTPDNHCHGKGCELCARVIRTSKQTYTKNIFIQKAIQKHGNKYDYSKTEYIKSNQNVIIICKEHGKFLQTPESHLSGAGCNICIHKTEAKLYNKILQLYPTMIIQFKQDWCKKIRCLPYDFCIPEYKIIIELDGAQHFRQIMKWSSPEEQFENDKYKEQCANDNGYSVIRLLQEDVFYDFYDWVKELCEAIEEIKSSNEITNVYLCKNGEYEQF
jgi:very-short-patch-repair endonuclease/ribosomal protein L36